MSTNNNLPRLGSAEAAKAAPKTQVLTIPDRGVTIVLRKPSVGMVLEVQDSLKDQDVNSTQDQFEGTVGIVSRMLVDPEMDAEELKAEVNDWSFSDWQVLQDAALELAGMREEDVQQTRAEFRESG